VQYRAEVLKLKALPGGARSLYERHTYFDRNMGARIKNIYFGGHFGLNMKLAIVYNLNFTKV
jgi:hypothetical protein